MTNIIYYKICPILSDICMAEWNCLKQECPYWIEHKSPGCGLSPMIEGIRKNILECVDKEMAKEYKNDPTGFFDCGDKEQ